MHGHGRVRWGAVAVLVATSACGTSEPVDAVQWGACPDYQEFAGVPAECEFVPVPLSRAASDGRTIDVFVARVRGSAPESQKRGQLYFVTGGPGASVIGFVKQAKAFAELRPDWDFYAFEHRGVGNSARLSCAAVGDDAVVTPEEAPDCLAELAQTWPEGIAGFSVSNAAEDLAHVIDVTRAPGRTTIVYGVSYGTYLVQRYLAMHPDQADGAVLDSIAAVGRAEYDDFDANVNDAARTIMDLCAADADCDRRLSTIAPEPFDALGVTLDAAAQGTLCPALQSTIEAPLDADDLRYLFGVMTERVPLRPLLPATVFRLDRCSADDVIALENLVDPIFFPDETPPASASRSPTFVPYEDATSAPVLYSHIVLSELWSGTPLAELERQAEGLSASLFAAVPLARLFDAHVWPTYRDPSRGLHARTDRPVLMLNAALDPQTPLADALRLRDDLHGPHQTFVTVPGAGHVVLLDSRMAGKDGASPADHCGTLITLSFIDDPSGTPDTSCLADVPRLSFDPDDPTNRRDSLENFGTEDLWGDAPPVLGRR